MLNSTDVDIYMFSYNKCTHVLQFSISTFSCFRPTCSGGMPAHIFGGDHFVSSFNVFNVGHKCGSTCSECPKFSPEPSGADCVEKKVN